jgi:hypothetical protein
LSDILLQYQQAFIEMLYERDPKLHEILAPFDANPPMSDSLAYNQQMTHTGAHTVLVPVAGQPRRKPFTHPQKASKTKNVPWMTRKKEGT